MRRLLLPPIAFLALALLSFLVPAPVWAGLWVRLVLAALPAAAGVALLVWARAVYARHGSEIDTFKTPRGLVTQGPFRFSRNPMYLGFTLALAGVAIAAGTAWAWIGPTAFVVLCLTWYIPFEERAAREAFGEAYVAWAERTPRWLGLPG